MRYEWTKEDIEFENWLILQEQLDKQFEAKKKLDKSLEVDKDILNDTFED